eukprot:TRINITY_DN32875_c2_g2_i1.p1 TRINITY_DN32875_c2_g2~~TRINITY_DN32875_c2_g2_i1.p1  ORF type:complete len:435 (-),score=50.00 TRINITY_DN32875_c2_g2_i1:50-1309(-)
MAAPMVNFISRFIALIMTVRAGTTDEPREYSPKCLAGCPGDPLGCPGDLCCSLNGKLKADGRCACRKPWKGPRCEVMGLLPVSLPQGYGMTPKLTTWGAGILFDGAEYHLYASAMTNNCSLANWQSNSRIEHASSPKITGPFVFKDVAVKTWSHNPAVLKLPDGSYALFHIGQGDGPPSGGAECQGELAATLKKGSTIHTSKSAGGPWTPLENNSLDKNCNNPAPWVHKNGTIFLVCSGGSSGNGLWRSESISGPWKLVTAGLTAAGGVWGVYEDPFLYIDIDGSFHLLFHVYETGENGITCSNTTVAAHLFSSDGFQWHTTPVQPFTSVISLADGGSMVVATRERGKILFNAEGRMTHLINGVSGLETCYNATECTWKKPGDCIGNACVNCKFKGWDFTLITPLEEEADEDADVAYVV